jgi:hypothetical protein
MPSAEDTQRDAKPIPDQLVIRGDATALRYAADSLVSRTLNPAVRGFVIPTDNEAYTEAIDNGAIAALHAAGFVICAPGTTDPALATGEVGRRIPGTGPADSMDAVLGPQA